MLERLSALFGRQAERPLSRIELFFLSKFGKPLDPGAIGVYLAATLQRDAGKMARSFLGAGLIEKASDVLSLCAAAKQADLKQALRDAGLKISGRKEELAARLVAESPERARAMTGGTFYVLTAAGRARVEAFEAVESEAADAFASKWIACWDRGDLKGALAVHHAWWDWKIQPPRSFNRNRYEHRTLEVAEECGRRPVAD